MKGSKKMAKRLVAMLMAAALTLSLAACGNDQAFDLGFVQRRLHDLLQLHRRLQHIFRIFRF